MHGLQGLYCVPASEQLPWSSPGRYKGLPKPIILPEPFSQGTLMHPPPMAKLHLPSSPKPFLTPGCSQLQTRAQRAFPGSWMLLGYILPSRRLPEESFFPSLKTAALGPGCVNTAKSHLIAADTRGLYLLGNDCVANVLNNSPCNVCPGYCGIRFIIRALGCTLLIILSNNLHSTVSV